MDPAASPSEYPEINTNLNCQTPQQAPNQPPLETQIPKKERITRDTKLLGVFSVSHEEPEHTVVSLSSRVDDRLTSEQMDAHPEDAKTKAPVSIKYMIERLTRLVDLYCAFQQGDLRAGVQYFQEQKGINSFLQDYLNIHYYRPNLFIQHVQLLDSLFKKHPFLLETGVAKPELKLPFPENYRYMDNNLPANVLTGHTEVSTLPPAATPIPFSELVVIANNLSLHEQLALFENYLWLLHSVLEDVTFRGECYANHFHLIPSGSGKNHTIGFTMNYSFWGNDYKTDFDLTMFNNSHEFRNRVLLYIDLLILLDNYMQQNQGIEIDPILEFLNEHPEQSRLILEISMNNTKGVEFRWIGLLDITCYFDFPRDGPAIKRQQWHQLLDKVTTECNWYRKASDRSLWEQDDNQRELRRLRKENSLYNRQMVEYVYNNDNDFYPLPPLESPTYTKFSPEKTFKDLFLKARHNQ